jgi:glutamyl-tRNA(Gln) amidotransferase subunit E
LENDDDIRAVRLKGFGGLLDRETQTDVIFAQEFAGRVKVIACLDEYPNILYPTSPYADGITDEEWDAIFQRVDAKHTDEVMIVWGGTDDVRTACKEIAIRAVDATNGVPSETRQAMPDGTTDFERILPGPDRMYPDTDLPPTPITDDHLETIRERLPEYPWEREKRYEKMGLPEDVIYTLPISPQVDIFEKIVEQLDVDPLRVAIPLVQLTKHLRREGYDISKLTDDMVYDIYEKFQNKTFAKEAFLDIFEKIVSNGNETAEDVLNELNLLPPLTQPELEKIVETTVEKNKDVAIDETEKRAHFLMGELRDIRGRIDGKIIWQTVMDKL